MKKAIKSCINYVLMLVTVVYIMLGWISIDVRINEDEA